MSDDCIFCKIVKGEIPCKKIYEDGTTLAFLDIGPVSKGHTLVIPKEHAEFIYELSDETTDSLLKTVKKISKAVRESLDVDFNVLNNNGTKAGQVVKHVHFHILPRRGDGKEINFEWPLQKYDDGEDIKIIEKIKEKLVN